MSDGALNIVTGLGEEAGAALSSHRGVAHLSFTGSVATGRRIAQAVSGRFIKLQLELGGKDPVIVTRTADIERAATVEPAQRAVDLAGYRVLLVEDNFVNRELALELLTSVGLDADAAERAAASDDEAIADLDEVIRQVDDLPLLSVADHCLRSRNCVNVIVAGFSASAVRMALPLPPFRSWRRKIHSVRPRAPRPSSTSISASPSEKQWKTTRAQSNPTASISAIVSALAHPYHNLLPRDRRGAMRVFFPDNSDPVTFDGLLSALELSETCFATVT